MEQIYQQIDTIFDNPSSKRPKWADELFEEIQELKALLKAQTQQTQQKSKKENNDDFFDFLKEFRKNLQTDTAKSIKYQGQKLGVDTNGLLYDKETLSTLSRQKAYLIYNHFYRESLKDNFSFEKVLFKD